MTMPDFFLIGAPKAGTTALHAALAQHPSLWLSPVKEPKYFLCAGAPPSREGQRGPGDAHSAREWIWRESEYRALFAKAGPGLLRGESTPFYLYDRAAHRRIHEAVPKARLIAMLRDPVDRAHSNWMHLWSDGLEPIGDFVAACDAEQGRIEAGYAPFWHYRALSRYAEQLEHLYRYFPREQVLVLRYRDLVDRPVQTLAEVHAFLGVEPAPTALTPRASNSRPFVVPSNRQRLLSVAVRAGAHLGAYAPPRVWRHASRPLLAALHAGGGRRPPLTVEDRRRVLAPLTEDVERLSVLTGNDYSDWLSDQSLGEFAGRRAGEPGEATI